MHPKGGSDSPKGESDPPKGETDPPKGVSDLKLAGGRKALFFYVLKASWHPNPDELFRRGSRKLRNQDEEGQDEEGQDEEGQDEKGHDEEGHWKDFWAIFLRFLTKM